jgi:hypothetical protein
MPGNASPRAIGSVLALSAADVLQQVTDGDRAEFIRVAHGLLFAAAIRLVFQQVQDVEVLPLLFTSAAYINALFKEVASKAKTTQVPPTPSGTTIQGGGLIAPSQLETLKAQLQAGDIDGALTTARRYLKLSYDERALFGTIALVAAQTDAVDDQGHTLQIVQATAEEFAAWPRGLAATSADAFLYVALRAAAFGKRDQIITNL